MAETLLSPSNILLYGRELQDLVLNFALEPDAPSAPVSGQDQRPDEPAPLRPPGRPPRKGDNNFLERQLEAPEARLARIYGFSYEGRYYDLAKPAIFLVHGPGSDPEAIRPASAVPDARFDRAPADADRTGVAQTDSSFCEDIRVWSYDKGDFSIRMDVETGTLEQILLEAALRRDRRSFYSGAEARLSGAEARLSGAEARLSGAEARLRNRGGWSD